MEYAGSGIGGRRRKRMDARFTQSCEYEDRKRSIVVKGDIEVFFCFSGQKYV